MWRCTFTCVVHCAVSCFLSFILYFAPTTPCREGLSGLSGLHLMISDACTVGCWALCPSSLCTLLAVGRDDLPSREKGGVTRITCHIKDSYRKWQVINTRANLSLVKCRDLTRNKLRPQSPSDLCPCESRASLDSALPHCDRVVLG